MFIKDKYGYFGKIHSRFEYLVTQSVLNLVKILKANHFWSSGIETMDYFKKGKPVFDLNKLFKKKITLGNLWGTYILNNVSVSYQMSNSMLLDVINYGIPALVNAIDDPGLISEKLRILVTALVYGKWYDNQLYYTSWIKESVKSIYVHLALWLAEKPIIHGRNYCWICDKTKKDVWLMDNKLKLKDKKYKQIKIFIQDGITKIPYYKLIGTVYYLSEPVFLNYNIVQCLEVVIKPKENNNFDDDSKMETLPVTSGWELPIFKKEIGNKNNKDIQTGNSIIEDDDAKMETLPVTPGNMDNKK